MDRTEWLRQTSPVEDMPEDLVKEVKTIMDKITVKLDPDAYSINRWGGWYYHKKGEEE